MKLIYKPLVLYSLLFALLGATLAMLVSFVLPNQNFSPKSVVTDDAQSSFKVAKAFNLEVKKAVVLAKAKQATSKDLLLTEFSISSIFISDDEKMVIVNDPKGGVFLYLNSSYKGYKLVEVYTKKAKFVKGIDSYWAFLNPDDEKNFETNSQLSTPKSGDSNIRETVAKKMFQEIKFKNGKYFIPRDMLNSYSSLGKIFSTIGIQIYNINGSISFKVSYLAPSSIFVKLGIKRGDMITLINNRAFKSASEPLKLFQNIKNLKQLTLTVKRGGKTKELKYEIY